MENCLIIIISSNSRELEKQIIPKNILEGLESVFPRENREIQLCTAINPLILSIADYLVRKFQVGC